jgi:hypothetical protein
MANPAPLFTFPTEPITTQPTIIVTSPIQNQTYASNEMLLALTIVKPETLFAFEAFHHEDHSPGTRTFVNISSVYYVIDDGDRQTIQLILNISTVLPLTMGIHNIKVGLEADSYYVVKYTYNLSDALSSIKLYVESTPVTFEIAAQPEPRLDSTSTAVIIASTAIVIIVGSGLLVHFRKRMSLR